MIPPPGTGAVASPLGPAVAELGESPRWDATAGVVQWVDILGGKIHRTAVDGTTETVSLSPPVTVALPAGGRTALAGLGRRLALVDLDDPARERTLAEVPAPDTVRLNDAACDPAGRVWAGTMDNQQAPGAGALYRLDGHGLAEVVSGTTISNGLDWSPDGGVFYFIDTPTLRIDAFDFDADAGALHDRRPFVDVSATGGRPDGLCVDADGGVWVALVRIGEVHRYDADGTLSHVVSLPVTRPTACAFGGPDLTTLYVTTALERLTDDERAAQPLAGRLFAASGGGARGLPDRPYPPDSKIVSAASADGS